MDPFIDCTFYWFRMDDFVLKSYNSTSQKKLLNIHVLKWFDSTSPVDPTWKSDFEIESYLNYNLMDLYLKNNYFQFDNLDSPVNQFVQVKNTSIIHYKLGDFKYRC